MFEYTYTDTFGGEPNFCWVERGEVSEANNLKHALRLARKKVGLTGVKGRIVANNGDEVCWKPNGMNTIIMIGVRY